MLFNILEVRTEDESDAALYPILAAGRAPHPIATEPEDGTEIWRLQATGLRVIEVRDGKRVQLAELLDVDVDLLVTASRVIVACQEFEKSGKRWHTDNYLDVTGYVAAGLANAIGRARAKSRNRGRCLVGHVRYPWLTQVGATTRTERGTHNALRLQIREKTTHAARLLLLEILLGKSTDAPAIAQRIAQLCAQFHLDRNAPPGSEHHDVFRALATAPVLMPEPKKYAFHVMPSYYYARPDTAYLSRTGLS